VATKRKIRIERPANCRFDERKADRAVQFFAQYLTHGQQYVGQPFVLAPWQEIDIREVFGRVDDDGKRIIDTVVKFVPKKNGKSEEAAAIAAKLLFADDEYGALVYGAAADREQASIVFDVAAGMVKRNVELTSVSKVLETRKSIIFPEWEGKYVVVSREAATKHGPNLSGVVFDEFHTQRDTRLWEVLTFGASSAREQPLRWAISTAGIQGESPVAEMLWEQCDQILRRVVPCPPDFYPVIYAAPEDADWKDEEVWHAANPALGDFLKIDKIRKEYETARARRTEQNSFRRLRLNQWTAQDERWIDMDDWARGGKFSTVKEYENWRSITVQALQNHQWFLGIDLSTKLDLTALVAVCIDDSGRHHWLPWFWIPRDNLADRPNVEADKYRVWVKQGFVTATPGAAIEFDAIRAKVQELAKLLRIRQIAYDPRFAEHLRQDLEKDGFECVEMPQGFRLNEASQEFETGAVNGNINHGGHPVLAWNVDCVRVQQNATGAIRPVKPDRKKSSKRIDGVVAGLMGTQRAMITDTTPRVSVYATGVGV
jgi:phage terminase large subunit-like protein